MNLQVLIQRQTLLNGCYVKFFLVETNLEDSLRIVCREDFFNVGGKLGCNTGAAERKITPNPVTLE